LGHLLYAYPHTQNIAFLSFLGFTALQFVFAFIANSQSMLTDCAAMTVDVVSYFINYVAEKLKDGRHERTVLYLELFPPIFSVITLVMVTAVALDHAIAISKNAASLSSLHGQPNIGLMLLFSSLNLVLDFLNVGCFARTDFEPLTAAGSITSTSNNHHRTVVPYGAAADDDDGAPTKATAHEHSRLLGGSRGKPDDESSSSSSLGVIGNLNMCSAWTHVCADTLRSIAVLLAAGLATLFPDQVSPLAADSNGTIVVSLVILVSLGPLLHALYRTACEIVLLERDLREIDRV
jgi:Co/Zn/Cd efflux system component